MYLSEIRLWNFRKYTNNDGSIDEAKPHLSVPFTKGLNVLIGENDSGKTAIIDAIKLVTKTHSLEWIRLEDTDFSKNCNELRIDLIFDGLTCNELAAFTPNLYINPEDGKENLYLVLEASRNEERILPYEIKAYNGTFCPISANERDLIKATYLRALRDADNDLTAKKNSRFSQILLGHNLFKEGEVGRNSFIQILDEANGKIKDWFIDNNGGLTSNKKQIKDIIDNYIQTFLYSSYESEMTISGSDIKSILERISIGIKDQPNLGLGSMNRLFMATELLHLNKKNNGIKLCLIEELEAHLHPQAQMKVIEGLQSNNEVQFIMSTHSPNLASKIKLSKEDTSIILCRNKEVFPLTKGKTKLDDKDYKYLENFLDVTKSNLFFANGVIIVEGWAEDLLLPVLANNIGKNFTKHEVSVINVGSTAYLHYAKILMRNDNKKLDYPVAIVTDLDIRPNSDWTFDVNKEKNKQQSIKNYVDNEENENVQLYLATHWTLEWCLFKSNALSELFMECCEIVHSKTDEFKKNDKGERNSELFRKKLAEKLENRYLNKVAIATELCKKIQELTSPLNIQENDEAYYLIKAINHVCR